MINYEFYPTPAPFTRWMLREVAKRLGPIEGTVVEPCAGAGDITNVVRSEAPNTVVKSSDLDPRWGHPLRDAIDDAVYVGADWAVTNPPFSLALEISDAAVRVSSVGVALYHRCTLREPLKGCGLGRSFFREHPPTLTLWCPRWAHQRSQKTGKWATDSAPCVWSIWKHGVAPQGDVWPPDSLFDEVKAYTPIYRSRVDALMAQETR